MVAMSDAWPERDWSRTSSPSDPVQHAIEQVSIRDRIEARLLEDGNYGVTPEEWQWSSFAYFLSRLRDDRGRPLDLPWHIDQWAQAMQDSRLLCLMAARDHGKAQPVDFPIPTPTGWTTMGDLKAGDEVFDEHGVPCRVTVAHPVRTGRPCYRVAFNDGSSVVADADHLWLTWDKAARVAEVRDRKMVRDWPERTAYPKVRTTLEIAATLTVGRSRPEWNHSIPVAGPLRLPDADLPIPPYVLGMWLAEGTEGAAQVTLADQDAADIERRLGQDGYGLRVLPSTVATKGAARTYSIGSGAIERGAFVSALRSVGVLDDKRIPVAYLRASEGQRRALLAGLMDGDGHAHKDGSVEITQVREGLSVDIHELAISLGFKAKMLEGRATIAGVDKGPKWRVYWTPRVPVFDLPRKAALLRAGRSQATRTTHRHIVSVEPVESVPVRCITVDSPSSLYLTGRSMVPTHNSWTVYAYIAWRIWRHNRKPDGTMDWSMPDGALDIVYVTEADELARRRMESIKAFLTDNLLMFHEVLPVREGGSHHKAGVRPFWNKRSFRLRHNAALYVKSLGASMRGLHPQLLIGDDVVSDKNSATVELREKVWNYLTGTMMPMVGANRTQGPDDDPRDFGSMFVIGTPQHYDDALHRLKGKPGWRHMKYVAADMETGECLWPERYDIEALRKIQMTNPVIFSREYLMDPRDDSTSLFPWTLTAQALMNGQGWTYPFTIPMRSPGDVVVMGVDLAVSEEVGSDFTVVKVVAYNRFTQKRRMLWATQQRGLDWHAVVELLRTTIRNMGVDIGVVEENGFQRWLRQHLMRYPETATRLYGHNTGLDKQDLSYGVPGMKLAMLNHLWEVPSGLDAETLQPKWEDCAKYVSTWRTELQGMGIVNGKLKSATAHDDTVMATWFVERGITMVESLMGQAEGGDYVGAEDIGVEKVRIGDY